MKSLKTYLTFISILFLAIVQVNGKEIPQIFWASSPVNPNETVMLQGGNFSLTAKVQIAKLEDGVAGVPEKNMNMKLNWENAEILQINLASIKFLIPADWNKGIYAYRIIEKNKKSGYYLLNAPEVWWFQGNLGEKPSSNGWLRIMGNCLLLDKDHNPQVKIKNTEGNWFDLPVIEASKYDLKLSVPEDIQSGAYQLYVHNGYGNKSGWKAAGEITIEAEKKIPSKIFNVKELDLEKAISGLTKNNGGVLYFPGGEYKIDSALILPDNTIIQGDSREMSVIYWTDLDKDNIPDALIKGSNLGIRDISIYCQNMYHSTIKAEGGTLKMLRVRVRANPYFMLGRTGHEITFRGRTLNGELNKVKAVVYLSKVNGFELNDCDIVGYDGIKVWNTSNGIISNCKVQYGRNGFGCEAAYHVIVENSKLEGMDMAATGNFFATYFANAGEFMYLKNNFFANAYGLDQEFFTFDATGGAYIGKIKKTSGDTITLANDPVFKRYVKADNWVNSLLCIMDGTGVGQYRRVKSHSGREWEINEPWDINPDTTSIISIVPFRGNTIVYGNTFKDGGAVQFYGTSIRNIIAENKGERMSGFYIWGQEARGWGWQPSWYNQVLDNKIIDGYNYRHQTTRLAVMGTVSKAQVGDYQGPLSRCSVVRNNFLGSNSIISVTGQSSDVIIENNSINNSDFGIAVEKQFQTGIDVNSQYYKDHGMNFEAQKDLFGVLIRNNDFFKVNKKYSGDGIVNASVIDFDSKN